MEGNRRRETNTGRRVLILGGGLAGLAAASALAPRGFQVAILEARNRLGGRASSFQDPASGEWIDACQHATLGCCTNFAHLCRTIGIEHLLQREPNLYFMTPDRRVSVFRGDNFPAPLHLGRSFLAAHFLTSVDKARIAWGLACLKRHPEQDDPPLADWLAAHGQTPRTIQRFWGLILVSALNEAPERLGLRYARKVFLEAFLGHRLGFEVYLPRVPLGRLYGAEMLSWFKQHHVELRLLQGARTIEVRDGRVTGVELRQGERLEADWYISAVPFDRLLGLLPDDLVQRETYFSQLRRLETSPITSIHCWWDRPIMSQPHVVLVDCLGQWAFNRGGNPQYVQVVISAARALRGLGHDEIERRIVAELRGLFPRSRDARLVRSRVVTEHAATFSAVPGVDRWRPQQASPLSNLLVAGDWTQTGWPATMEGAVRSGYLAAEALLARVGMPARLVQAELTR